MFVRGTLIAIAAAGAIAALGCKNKQSPRADTPAPSTEAIDAQRAAAPPIDATAGSPAPPRLSRSAPLDPAARALLKAPMQSHVETVSSLLWNVVMLDRPAARRDAEALAATPRIAKPNDMPDADFARLLPERFLSLEGEMLAAAASVGPAANESDPKALSRAVEQLTGTCVACHDVYLRMPDASGSTGENTLPAPTEPLAPMAEIELDPSDELGEEAHLLLQHWMGRHGDEIEELFWAAITLKYEPTYEIASGLAEHVAGTHSNLEDLGAEVSGQFLALRGEFEQRLLAIANAAAKRDAAATAEAFAAMTTTCVRCHQVYLGLPGR